MNLIVAVSARERAAMLATRESLMRLSRFLVENKRYNAENKRRKRTLKLLRVQ